MPRIVVGRGTVTPPAWFAELVDRLAGELKSGRESGQPVIREDHFPRTGKIRVVVLWDEWANIPHEQRVEIIRQAYSRVESEEFNDKITLIVGLTFPEAREAGMLPFRVLGLLRKSDPVSEEECLDAMNSEGPSDLFPGGPQLWFASKAEAEAAIRRLVERLPKSADVWAITQDADWAEEES